MNNKILTIGYIGNGKSANRYHLPFSYKRKDKIKVKMIYDLKITHEIWKKLDDVIYTEDINDILNDPEIDVIVISTPSQFHYEYALKVLNANKHCVVEKPFMETLEQAKEICRTINNSFNEPLNDLDYIFKQKKIYKIKNDTFYEYLGVSKEDLIKRGTYELSKPNITRDTERQQRKMEKQKIILIFLHILVY